MLSSFLILRYFNPALLCPDVFGIIDRELSANVRRPLVLVRLLLLATFCDFLSNKYFIFMFPPQILVAFKNHSKLRQWCPLWRQGGIHAAFQWHQAEGHRHPQGVLQEGYGGSWAPRVLCGNVLFPLTRFILYFIFISFLFHFIIIISDRRLQTCQSGKRMKHASSFSTTPVSPFPRTSCTRSTGWCTRSGRRW